MLSLLLAAFIGSQSASSLATSGHVTGRVVSTYPAGLAAVRVTLQRIDGDAQPQQTVTDVDGRFRFQALPEGRYVVAARHAGYTSARLENGRLQAGIEITVRRGQPTAHVELRLWREASLAGRVIRSDGAAAPGIHVGLAQRSEGRVVVLPDTQVTTEWDGRYTIGGLPPGHYLVMATGVDAASSRGSLSTPSPEQAAFEINGTRPEEFTPTLYPGVPATELGATVTLLEGLATSGVDIWLTPARRFSMSGRITWPDDTTVKNITIEYGNPSDRRANIWTVSDPDGLFTIDAVAPGTVVLLVSADSNRGRLLGVASTDVRADDVEDIRVTLVAPARIEGRVVFPSDLSSASRPRTIALVPRLLNVSPLFAVPQAPIAEDGTFTLSNALGQYDFELPGMNDRFRIVRVSREDQVFRGNRIGVDGGDVVDRIVVTVAAR